MSSKAKSKWADIEQQSFDNIKLIVARNNLLSYKYSNKLVDVHMDAIDFELVLSGPARPNQRK